jgi:hypothetical protein
MYRSTIRHLTAAGAIALIATVPLAACADRSVSPRPVEAAESASPAPATGPPSSAATSASGGAAQATRPKPVRTRTTTTTRPATTAPSDCRAGRYNLDLQNTELALIKSMCFRTGGILRMKNIGPGLVTATPERLVSQSYEAAVVDLRFVRPGTVTVTIPLDEQTYTITVVVVS